MLSHDKMTSLVDIKNGLISREIFVNDDLYQQEQEQVFARAWLFIGHESQIPESGDYVTSCMGEESVILTRDRERQIHVFLNTCRHRGMKVCRYDEGNTPVFTCPYHGWSFATDGRLVGVPHNQAAYRGQLDASQWGLIEVAQMTNYKGTIWATWDPEAPSFLDYLGEMKCYLDTVLDCRDGRDGESEVIGGIQKWTLPANWKFAAENFAGDAYHNISHRSVDMVGIGPSGEGRRDNAERKLSKRVSSAMAHLGHSAVSILEPEEMPFASARARGYGVSERVIFGPATALDRRMATTRSLKNGSVALVSGRQRRAIGSERCHASLRHALFRPGWTDRTGRYGELELRFGCEPRRHRPALSLQLRDGTGLRISRLRHPGPSNGAHF